MNGTLDPSGLHAFTWAPNPIRYNSHDPCEQYLALLQSVLLGSKDVFEYFVFYPELTESGNVHIHGYFIIKDKVKYFKWFLPKCKSLGYVCVKTHNVDDKWKDYCAKSLEYTREVFKNLPVPLSTWNWKQYKRLRRRKTPYIRYDLRTKTRPLKYNIGRYFK